MSRLKRGAAPRGRETAPLDERTFVERWTDRGERVLEGYSVRVVLSLLIILSVLPLAEILGALPGAGMTARGQVWLDVFFFVVFAGEFAVRAAVYARLRQERRGRAELALLLLDLLAVLSFLPLSHLVDLRYVRLIRLSRIILLFGYWGPMVRDLWAILSSRERRFQVAFVLLSGLILAFAGAVVLRSIADPESSGDVAGEDFVTTLWWSFRQVQDPGNLVAQPEPWAVVGVSLFLTLSGLVLFSFLVGIGTNSVEELMERSRRRPVGLRNHTVILGLGEHSHFLLEEFAEIYRKNRRALRSAVLGPESEPPVSSAAALEAFAYRRGNPVHAADLERVDIHRAKRVLILGTEPSDPDAGVVAAILALRDRAPRVELYPDLEHESNLPAARTAGGAHTHVIGSGSFVGNYIAQNVANPGIYRLYRQLLTSTGCEIYTYVLSEEEAQALHGTVGAGGAIDCRALHERARRDHGVTLLGYFVAPQGAHDPDVDDLEVLLAPCGTDGPGWVRAADGRVRGDVVRGFVGVALRWEALRSFGRSVVKRPVPRAAPADAPSMDVRLCPVAGDVRRVVVVGESRRIPRVVADLIAFYGAIEVMVLARDGERVDVVSRDLDSALQRTLPRSTVVTSREPDALVFEVTIPEGTARVRFAQATWGDATRIAHDPVVALDRTDVVLFLPRTRGAGAMDGQVALDCLQLAEMEDRGAAPYPDSARVIAMIQDPIKGDLLEHRLDATTGGAQRERFTVVSSERVRHHFIVQNVFVRGLNSVYTVLFAPEGPSLRRVEARTASGARPSGSVEIWALARHLFDHAGLVLLGVELADPEHPDAEPRTVLDPAEIPAGKALAWNEVRALYVLGEEV